MKLSFVSRLATAPIRALSLTILLVLLAQIQSGDCETYLLADGETDTYELVDSVFGGNSVEVPDCVHEAFGQHVTQVQDAELNRPVFAFHSHILIDDDRCQKFDRQRTEIKTHAGSSEELVGYYGDRVTLSWNFKLDAGFLPPYSFCHLHQLKAVGGDDSMPVITITARRSTPNELQLLQYDSFGKLLFLATEPLEPFLGSWIHATSDITYGSTGKYHIQLSRVSDGEVLLDYQSQSIDFWRNETEFIRPKWGIYRSVQERVLSRDETVYFDSFCVGKDGSGDCA